MQHGLTVRSDSLQDLIADLCLIKAMVRQARAKAAERAPEQDTPEPEPDGNARVCKVHSVAMVERISKKTGRPFLSHRMPDDTLCFGRERKA